ncbi:MAG: ATP-binding protein [Moorea sp. SIO3I7]|uniref:AAA family ATPase n=1 Tax=Moorena bouillonii PNG TaxID=568701 RepID=A0A1U7N5Q4_9CYAN|nr:MULTISPECIES: ATP-binding protein [Moorena]NEN98850.1 ATP-binding protein [Moorena sp. SIO3I7]NEO48429.1 ATP-binding protein [Moorena sp. SIO4A3]NEO60101.1 ATP-binding protein [Moorena sp. SIO4G2]NEP26898.1 ATP-binding protein [Moorena sp. SIO3I6]OLT61283.1 AAA family ATPase [Moorena bouillonii PNG]
MINQTQVFPPNPQFQQLFLLLQRLDGLLERALAAAQVTYGSMAATNPYRGMQVDQEEVEQLLTRPPGTPVLQVDTETEQELPSDAILAGSSLAWLQETFALSAFDVDIIAIALAPELDRRYERIYTYLQDDIRCKRPTVDLVLNLLCPTGEAKLARRSHFTPEAPLLGHSLLHLVSDPNQLQPTLLAHNLKLDGLVLALLLGEKGLDQRLKPFSTLLEPTISLEELPLHQEVKQALLTIVVEDWQASKPLALYFEGADTSVKHRAAQAIARAVEAPLLTVNLTRVVEAKADLELTLKLAYRQAWFQKALVYLEGLETLQQTIQSSENSSQYLSLLRIIADHQGITILAGEKPWRPEKTIAMGMVTVPFPIPEFTVRRWCWQNQLTAAGISLDRPELDALCDRFRLNSEQITDAVIDACNRARWRIAQNTPPTPHTPNLPHCLEKPTLSELFAAARAQSGHQLGSLARQIQPKYSWDDIVLPVNQKAQLREICNQAKYRQLVWEEWDFQSKLSLGRGLNVMFSGPPGTGKTMAAEIIAHELELDLYKIDLSQVVSKYIGETEKNLNRIFTAAANANAILLFDEADSLFGKRSEISSAHDRYANIEVGYLLQKMEEYEGVAILTTNLRTNMDDAFVRRLRFIIEFPFPNLKDRRRIWEQIWPSPVPRSEELDLDFIARNCEIAGGNIRNIALAAAFIAADDGGIVKMNHLLRAVRREYQKMGKVLIEGDFGQYAGLM